jgi:hypothetical protein
MKMQTKEEIAKEYTLNRHGIVSTPGKFEGEPWYVVALWERTLEGRAEHSEYDGDTEISSFMLTSALREIIDFDRTDPRAWISLWEREDGFVVHALRMDDEVTTDNDGVFLFSEGES